MGFASRLREGFEAALDLVHVPSFLDAVIDVADDRKFIVMRTEHCFHDLDELCS
jgi:hypothetical protein